MKQINFYRFYKNPEILNGFKIHREKLPYYVWWKLFALNEFTTNDKTYEKYEKIWTIEPDYAYSYAYKIIKRKFELAEKTIAKSGWWSYNYAKHVLQARFELGEEAIAKDPYCSEQYNLFLEIINTPKDQFKPFDLEGL